MASNMQQQAMNLNIGGVTQDANGMKNNNIINSLQEKTKTAITENWWSSSNCVKINFIL